MRSRFGIALAALLFTAPTFAAPDAPSGVAFRARGDGEVITNTAGMTLYTFGRDLQPGKSACNGPCAKLWPPLLVAGDAQAAGDWSVITRDDGSKQWAFRGHPLYAYSKDQAPGHSYGDDLNKQWHIAFRPMFTPAEVSIVGTLKGQVLANAKGLSLYTSKSDKPNQSNCAEACARTWIPLAAPWAATNRGDWSTVKRNDGTKQWAYRGQPLYTHAGDAQASATSGDGLDPKWQVAVVEPPPPLPGFVKVHQSDAGELYTDGRGKTLYQREVKRAAGLGFNEADLQSVTVPRGFQPVTPENTEDAKPVGNWALVDNGGKKQWAYKGLALYTNDNDIAPGDLKGVRGTDRSFYTIMRSGELMQGTGQ